MDVRRSGKVALVAALLSVAGGLTTYFAWGKLGPRTVLSRETSLVAVKPKVLFVDSYHEGYPWSEGIIDGALKTLAVVRAADGRLDDRSSSVQLRIVRMDTKRNPSEQFGAQAGRRVKGLIDSWKPDVVIRPARATRMNCRIAMKRARAEAPWLPLHAMKGAFWKRHRKPA